MSRKNDIQYVRYYTQGSAARVLEPQTPDRKTALRPKTRKAKQKLVHVDPLAIGGILVAAVMLVLMVVGSVRLYRAQQKQQLMENHVASLSQKNVELNNTYKKGYDLQEVEESALALGMIPEEEARHITITAFEEQAPAQEEQNTWERIWSFLAGLFA